MTPQLLLTFALAFLISFNLFAEPDVELGPLRVRGPQCPKGSVSATLSPDNSVISILFDDFSVKGSRGATHSSNLIKKCQFIIPIKVKAGHVLVAANLDYRGFMSIPQGLSASITSEGPMISYRTGQSVDKITTQLGEGIEEFFVSQSVKQDRKVRCKHQEALEFFTTIQVMGPMMRGGIVKIPDSLGLTLDSIDMGQPEVISIGVELLKCD